MRTTSAAKHQVKPCDTISAPTRPDPRSKDLLDEVFGAEGIRIVRTAAQAPRMNAIIERWVGSVRLLDRILIVNVAHLRKVLTEYEDHFNARRPHRALNQASPLRPFPDPNNADIKVIRREPAPSDCLYQS
jgi:putative transposase